MKFCFQKQKCRRTSFAQFAVDIQFDSIANKYWVNQRQTTPNNKPKYKRKKNK